MTLAIYSSFFSVYLRMRISCGQCVCLTASFRSFCPAVDFRTTFFSLHQEVIHLPYRPAYLFFLRNLICVTIFPEERDTQFFKELILASYGNIRVQIYVLILSIRLFNFFVLIHCSKCQRRLKLKRVTRLRMIREYSGE